MKFLFILLLSFQSFATNKTPCHRVLVDSKNKYVSWGSLNDALSAGLISSLNEMVPSPEDGESSEKIDFLESKETPQDIELNHNHLRRLLRKVFIQSLDDFEPDTHDFFSDLFLFHLMSEEPLSVKEVGVMHGIERHAASKRKQKLLKKMKKILENNII